MIRIPYILLKNMSVLPGQIAHCDVADKKEIQAVEKCLLGDEKILAATVLDEKKDEINETEAGTEDVYRTGCLCIIKQLMRLQNGMVRVSVLGSQPAEIEELCLEKKELIAHVNPVLEPEPSKEERTVRKAMGRVLKEQIVLYQSLNRANDELLERLMKKTDFSEIADGLMAALPVPYVNCMEYLNIRGAEHKYEFVLDAITQEILIEKTKQKLQSEVKTRISKSQKEFVLREELKVIREELGDDTSLTDADAFLEKTEALKADAEVKEKLRSEIKRFRLLLGNPAESSVLRSYIEYMLELPWNKKSKDNYDLKRAERILDEDHYGMYKIKERILEYLAVRRMTKRDTAPILCLVGPPGTGKTSIVRSIAAALQKKYVRICLGGVRDEAEIRGHRRTYVGAMPGRIVGAVRQAGVKNPLILFDEIDKLGTDYKGDPSSALLEVLDGEQNGRFRDHYLEVPLDLSEALFVCTANTTDTIPGPLLDRMEIIRLSGYTSLEKEHIAKNHLIPKQRKKHGLSEEQFIIEDEAVSQLVTGYTREAGVRQLERQIGALCRKYVKTLLMENREKSITVTPEKLEECLGRKLYQPEQKNTADEIGIVRGLAWTSVGGDTLEIEVNTMPGKGDMILTGKIGEVMKESARIALTYVRSVAEAYQVPDDFFEKNSIHIHVPEGAVPKDGPSAGITMATAILSAAAKIPVKANLAMTGELTLRGRVLPIGGLKEKILAARQAGISHILAPEKNQKEVAELEKEVTEGIEITYVSHMKEVLGQALV